MRARYYNSSDRPYTKEDMSKNRISIADSRNLLRFACEDLKALKAVMQVVEDEKDWPNEREMLSVVLRALDSIISDFEEGIDSTSEELKEGNSV